MKALRRMALAALPLALAACGLTRPPAAPGAPVPARWHAPLPSTSPGATGPGTGTTRPHGGSLPALADWWRQLDDPLLVELIDAAQTLSPNLASAAARMREARANRVSAGAALLPSLDANLNATRSNSSFGSTPGAGTAGSTAGSGSTGSAAAVPFTTLQASLQTRWEVDLFGRLRADRDAAQARADNAEAKWHEARVSVAAETANAYFSERACRRQLAVSESDSRSRAETARLTELSMKAGFTAPADAALARAAAANASARLTQQRGQCEIAVKSLVALSGLDEDTLRGKLAAAPAGPALPGIQPVEAVPAAALAQRPDVYAAEQAVAAASADVGSAEAERYPKLTLSGNIGRLQLRGSGYRQTLDSWSVGPVALTLPLLDGGARAANADAARARYEESVSLYRANVRQAVREVEEALVNLQSTDARADDTATAVQNFQASLDATQSRYDSGLASLFDLQDARRTLYGAQTEQVSLQLERAQAWVALYRAMGGGWNRPDGAAPSLVSMPTASKSP